MALIKLRRPENVAGDFFVDSTCIDCDLCRQIAPATFASAGEQSAVLKQPVTDEERFAALKSLVTCPTASIGALEKHSAKEAVAAYPEHIDGGVYFCGFAAESSYGASSYLVVRPGGNVLVDSPRFTRPLAKRIAGLGGIKTIFLTHRDDVADHREWAGRFDAARVMHADDVSHGTSDVERVISGHDTVALDDDLLIIPTPGHTRGHMVLLYKYLYLFSGDHLWWSDAVKSLYASRRVNWYSWSEQIDSVERLLGYEFEWVLPGHGRRAHAGADRMRGYLKDCIARMKGTALRAS
jgi:glyoxylase-like metal-dependent hydrolase (beta-lactamase superfamily II)/ferredoxin